MFYIAQNVFHALWSSTSTYSTQLTTYAERNNDEIIDSRTATSMEHVDKWLLKSLAQKYRPFHDYGEKHSRSSNIAEKRNDKISQWEKKRMRCDVVLFKTSQFEEKLVWTIDVGHSPKGRNPQKNRATSDEEKLRVLTQLFREKFSESFPDLRRRDAMRVECQ